MRFYNLPTNPNLKPKILATIATHYFYAYTIVDVARNASGLCLGMMDLPH